MAAATTTTNNGGHNAAVQNDVVVVMVPLPAQGHLHQFLELARRLSTSENHNIPVYYVGTTAHVRQAQSRARVWDPRATPNLHFSEFSVPFDVPPPNPDASTKFPSQLVPAFNSSMLLREPVAELVKSLSATAARKVVVIHDFLTAYVVQDVPAIPKTECYCFHTVSAFLMFSFIYESAKPNVDPEIEHVLKQLPSLEGCHPPEMEIFARKQVEASFHGAGNIFSSSRVIDGPYLELLAKFHPSNDFKQWALAPFNPVEIDEKQDSISSRHYCLEWLDKQAPNSVIFVSFGSTTSLSVEEIESLAIGLEKSEQKFIWVLRDADKGDIFTGEVRRCTLPEGYERRVAGRGIVIRDWAPQLEILGHKSTGGFMSHCGWNSCMESISMGVPIATWPMHSDQPRNALLVTKWLKIGIVAREWERRNEVVSSETIEMAVKTLMDSPEGEKIKQRAAELSEAVKSSVAEGGVTRNDMESFLDHITR